MYNFIDLDGTRKFMMDEVAWGIENKELYYSARFKDILQHTKWNSLIAEAVELHNEHWLALQLKSNLMFKGFEVAKKPNRGHITKRVPDNAEEVQASGQFNRYYMLGLCQRAISEGKKNVEIYRAKNSILPRQDSIILIGQQKNVRDLIEELRPMRSSLQSELLQFSSGLSIKLI